MITIASIGLGSRGRVYLGGLTKHKDVKATALCDINPAMLESAGKRFPQAQRFSADDAFFAAGKLADWCIIATWDPCHFKHATAALALGYNLILEKPVTANPAELEALCAQAKDMGATVLVCHVLRYSPFYSEVKRIIDSGVIGDVVNIVHEENVGYWHYAHSYVRGNWRNEKVAAPFLMAKCCHDFDLLHWLVQKPGEEPKLCESVQAYGELRYFNRNHMPEGATSHCLQGCPYLKTCPYSAEKLYIKKPSPLMVWGTCVAAGQPSTPPKEEMRRILKAGQYGRCVYQCDNDVCDHHSVAMRFKSGITATLSVSAFSFWFTRRTRVQGTKGELWGRDTAMRLHIHRFGKLPKIKRIPYIKMLSGHGGADGGFCEAAYKVMAGGPIDSENMTTIEQTRISHNIVYAAIESMK